MDTQRYSCSYKHNTAEIGGKARAEDRGGLPSCGRAANNARDIPPSPQLFLHEAFVLPMAAQHVLITYTAMNNVRNITSQRQGNGKICRSKQGHNDYTSRLCANQQPTLGIIF